MGLLHRGRARILPEGEAEMKMHQEHVEIATPGRGLVEVSEQIRNAVRASGCMTG